MDILQEDITNFISCGSRKCTLLRASGILPNQQCKKIGTHYWWSHLIDCKKRAKVKINSFDWIRKKNVQYTRHTSKVCKRPWNKQEVIDKWQKENTASN